MDCFIWYEDNLGFRIMRFDDGTSWQDVAISIPDAVDVVELMNRSALQKKLMALATLRVDIGATKTESYVS